MAKFDQEKQYSWAPGDVFDMQGKELEQLFNTTHTIVNTNVPLAQLYIMVYELFKTSGEILKRNVENDKIKEVEAVVEEAVLD